VFGGLTPFIAVLLTTMGHSHKFTGLLYPTLVIGLCVIIGAIYLNVRQSDASDNVSRLPEKSNVGFGGRRILDPLKKAFGVVWILLGPVALYFLVKTAISEIARNPIPSTRIQWCTFVIIFIPIAVGLVLFGYYALKGEYQSDDDAISSGAIDITID